MSDKPFPDHFVDEQACPGCGEPLNALKADGPGDPMPEPGTIGVAICDACGHAMAVDPDLTIRELTDEERAMIDGDQDVAEARKAIRQ